MELTFTVSTAAGGVFTGTVVKTSERIAIPRTKECSSHSPVRKAYRMAIIMVRPVLQSCYEYLIACQKEIGPFNAVVNMGYSVTSDEFVKDIDVIAGFLSQSGVKQGDVYTILLPTVGQSFAAFYAINKIGAVANILHPLSTKETVERSLKNTRSKGIFIFDLISAEYEPIIKTLGIQCIVCSSSDYAKPTGRAFLKLLSRSKAGKKKTEGQMVRYDDIISGKMGYCETKPVSGYGKDTAVYLHGGGTTGRPKTIMLSSFAINSLAYKISLLDRPHEVGKEYSLVVLPLFHAFGLCVAMHFCMCAGYGSVCMPKFNAKKANDIIKKYPVAYIVGVPNMFRKMYEESNFAGEHLKNLRLLFSGGDTVSEVFLQQFNAKIAKYGGSGRLMRGYGLTEMASVCCTNNFDYSRDNSIGVPLEGIDIEIWDDDRCCLSRNTIGEIVVSGDTMMNGYLQDEDIHETGIYTDKTGKNWICTGDMGYMDKEGYIYFTGRKKRMIIISGYNVYPYNIEDVVLKLKCISEACAVQGYDDDKPIVKLYVTLKEKVEDTRELEGDILKYCELNLDHFSVPRKIIVVNEFPRTQMGKIDFMKLTEPIPHNH